MTDTPITVVIPVGPEPHHRQYLDEAMGSLLAQTHAPAEVLLIDDMAGLDSELYDEEGLDLRGAFPLRTWRAPWRLGVAQAFNAGVALATYPLVMMMGADDQLKPDCLEQIARVYNANERYDGYYWVGVEYSDGREDQFLPCNAAAVTQGLWRMCGGFPVESGSGAPDAALISILMVHLPSTLVGVGVDRKPLYWYRVHEESETANAGPWQGVIINTRDLVTANWKPPAWGRYE